MPVLQGPGGDPGISFEDWEVMLSAVSSRLREAVAATLPHELNGATAPLQASVLDCVDALDQLHASLRLALAQPASLSWHDGRAGDGPGQAVKAELSGPAAAPP